MKETLAEIIKYSSSLFDIVKVMGSDEETKVEAAHTDNTVFLRAKTHAPVKEFKGVFGINNLAVLSRFLSHGPYCADGSTTEVCRRPLNDEEVVDKIKFRDPSGEGSEFILVKPALIPPQMEVRKIPWDLTVDVTKERLDEFRSLYAILGKAENFGLRTSGKKLIATFGEEGSATHAGRMVLHDNVTASIKAGAEYSCSHFLTILKLSQSSTNTIKIKAGGIIGIDVEAPFGSYSYILRAKR